MKADEWRELSASAAMAYDALYDLRVACTKAGKQRLAADVQQLMTRTMRIHSLCKVSLAKEVRKERATA